MKSFLALLLTATGTSALTIEDFKSLHPEIQPAQGAVWRSIPWKTDLLEAQAEAASERKPIFIWAMDGHPLGCT